MEILIFIIDKKNDYSQLINLYFININSIIFNTLNSINTLLIIRDNFIFRNFYSLNVGLLVLLAFI